MSWWRRRHVVTVEVGYDPAELLASAVRLATVIASWPSPVEVFCRALAGDPDPYGGPVTSTGAPLETAGEILQVVAMAGRLAHVSRGYGGTRPVALLPGTVLKKVRGDAIWRIPVADWIPASCPAITVRPSDAALLDVGDLLYV